MGKIMFEIGKGKERITCNSRLNNVALDVPHLHILTGFVFPHQLFFRVLQSGGCTALTCSDTVDIVSLLHS